jgi:hypothetical protein
LPKANREAATTVPGGVGVLRSEGGFAAFCFGLKFFAEIDGSW